MDEQRDRTECEYRQVPSAFSGTTGCKDMIDSAVDKLTPLSKITFALRCTDQHTEINDRAVPFDRIPMLRSYGIENLFGLNDDAVATDGHRYNDCRGLAVRTELGEAPDALLVLLL